MAMTYQRQSGFVAANLNDELALLDLAQGTYLGFNATAAYLWRQLDEPKTLDALCRVMSEEFDVESDRCRSEVAELLMKLTERGIVRLENDEVA